VLDIGGGAFFWDLALSEGLPLPQVTVLNIRPAGDDARSFLRWIVADARASQLRQPDGGENPAQCPAQSSRACESNVRTAREWPAGLSH